MATEKESTAIPASGIAILVAALIGFVVVHELPLEKYRPIEAEKSSYELLDAQDAESRLWQDPFAAVYRHQEALDKSGGKLSKEHIKKHEIDSLRTDIKNIDVNAQLTVFGVTVAGGPYVEDAEQRRRYRYAALAGLNVRGYAPVDGNHVGYVNTVKASADALTKSAKEVKKQTADADCDEKLRRHLPEKIPFEWMQRSDKRSGNKPAAKILVLWLNEHSLTKDPLKSLAALSKCLGLRSSPPNRLIKIVGPLSSETLENLVLAKLEDVPALPQIEVYSASATTPTPIPSVDKAPEASRTDEKTESSECPSPLQIPFGRLCILRTITSDDTLADVLVGELGSHVSRHIPLPLDLSHRSSKIRGLQPSP